MLHFSGNMPKLLLPLAVLLAFSSAPQSSRLTPAEEWEDPDLVIFFTGELRGYVEPCG
ncbi:MAG: hypothetical protein ACRD1X_17120 [Vicinamibacteria bacterium]